MRLLLLLAVIATPAMADERTIGIGSFDRLRVEGPFEVRVVAGSAPSARISGGRNAIGSVDIRQDGRTLVIRSGAVGVWGERPRVGNAEPLVVTLGTIQIAAITSVAGARITASAAKSERIDLSVSGTGAIQVGNATGMDVNATVIGAGSITVAGRSTRARLMANGPATIDAVGLDVGEIIVRLDGTGTINARARFTAQITNVGLGGVNVAGNAKCTVRTPGGGPVSCEEGLTGRFPAAAGN